MYAEYNDFEDPTKDWEFSVEFYPEEREEYKFYIAVQRQEPLRSEVPGEPQEARGRKARTSQRISKRMLFSSRHQASVRAGR